MVANPWPGPLPRPLRPHPGVHPQDEAGRRPSRFSNDLHGAYKESII